MSFDRQARIAAVFDQVVDEPAATRPASIERLCDGDQALADEVRALLDADAEPHPFLAEGVERLAAELLDAVDDPTLPRRFGRYVLVKYLDEGGMGAVYLAERDDTWSRSSSCPGSARRWIAGVISTRSSGFSPPSITRPSPGSTMRASATTRHG